MLCCWRKVSFSIHRMATWLGGLKENQVFGNKHKTVQPCIIPKALASGSKPNTWDVWHDTGVTQYLQGKRFCPLPFTKRNALRRIIGIGALLCKIVGLTPSLQSTSWWSNTPLLLTARKAGTLQDLGPRLESTSQQLVQHRLPVNGGLEDSLSITCKLCQ